jgi:hypothetical protein
MAMAARASLLWRRIRKFKRRHRHALFEDPGIRKIDFDGAFQLTDAQIVVRKFRDPVSC